MVPHYIVVEDVILNASMQNSIIISARIGQNTMPLL
jgi:hypothetical protein